MAYNTLQGIQAFHLAQQRRHEQRTHLPATMAELEAARASKDPLSQAHTSGELFGHSPTWTRMVDMPAEYASTEDAIAAGVPIRSTFPLFPTVRVPPDGSIDELYRLHYDVAWEGARVVRLEDDVEGNARWIGTDILHALPFKLKVHKAVYDDWAMKHAEDDSIPASQQHHDWLLPEYASILVQRRAREQAKAAEGVDPSRELMGNSETQQIAAGGQASGQTYTRDSASKEPVTPPGGGAKPGSRVAAPVASGVEEDRGEASDSAEDDEDDSVLPKKPAMAAANTEARGHFAIANQSEAEQEDVTVPNSNHTKARGTKRKATGKKSRKGVCVICCPVPKCGQRFPRGAKRTHVNKHLTEDHGVTITPHETNAGGNMGRKVQIQETEIRSWLRSEGHATDSRFFVTREHSDVKEEEEDEAATSEVEGEEQTSPAPRRKKVKSS